MIKKAVQRGYERGGPGHTPGQEKRQGRGQGGGKGNVPGGQQLQPPQASSSALKATTPSFQPRGINDLPDDPMERGKLRLPLRSALDNWTPPKAADPDDKPSTSGSAPTMAIAGSRSTGDMPIPPPQRVKSTVDTTEAFPPLAKSQQSSAALPKDSRTTKASIQQAEGGVTLDPSASQATLKGEDINAVSLRIFREEWVQSLQDDRANADNQTATKPSVISGSETEAVEQEEWSPFN